MAGPLSFLPAKALFCRGPQRQQLSRKHHSGSLRVPWLRATANKARPAQGLTQEGSSVLCQIPLLRFSLERGCVSAGTSLCQPAREAHCPSAATLTVSRSPAHASQAGQGQNPHGPGPAKCPRRGQHHPLYPCTCAVGCFALAEKGQETTDSGILTQAHVWGSILQGQELSGTAR